LTSSRDPDAPCTDQSPDRWRRVTPSDNCPAPPTSHASTNRPSSGRSTGKERQHDPPPPSPRTPRTAASLVATLAVAAAIVALAAPAGAHVTVHPSSVRRGANKNSRSGCRRGGSGAVDKLEVYFPSVTVAPVAEVEVEPHPGWTAQSPTPRWQHPSRQTTASVRSGHRSGVDCRYPADAIHRASMTTSTSRLDPSPRTSTR